MARKHELQNVDPAIDALLTSRENELRKFGELLRQQLAENRCSQEAQDIFNDWVVDVSLETRDSREAETDYRNRDSTFYDNLYTTASILIYSREAYRNFVFLHEFRHLIENNRNLPEAPPFSSERGKREMDADPYALFNLNLKGFCGCYQ